MWLSLVTKKEKKANELMMFAFVCLFVCLDCLSYSLVVAAAVVVFVFPHNE